MDSSNAFSQSRAEAESAAASSDCFGTNDCFSTRSAALTPLLRILGTIPPERVGLNGEYDHSGLAKRVSRLLNEQFQPAEVAHLRISQRGTVVVIVGKIASPRLMARLVSVVLDVRGAADVEINGDSMIRSLCVSAIEPDYEISSQSFAY
ncbi:MAG: 2-dehydro-3-deoxygalactonokinase [Leptolyngbyaceae cyanobacterium SM1_3_5]|nr:2-dehydro-3-deoxygalactonokinase [Leptolyngbyaceae cyanobacterium SM1_3_5]